MSVFFIAPDPSLRAVENTTQKVTKAYKATSSNYLTFSAGSSFQLTYDSPLSSMFSTPSSGKPPSKKVKTLTAPKATLKTIIKKSNRLEEFHKITPSLISTSCPLNLTRMWARTSFTTKKRSLMLKTLI